MECQDKKMRIFYSFFLLLIKVLAKSVDFYSGDFYQRGIENLVERWEEVVNNNGEYVID